jgi:hypothetical protein
MAVPPGKVPILQSAGEAVRFLREHWRFALMVGAGAGLAQGATIMALGPTWLGLLMLGIVAAFAHAAYLRRAIPAEPQIALAWDALRVFAAMAVVAVILTMVAFAASYGAMGVLIAPYAEEAQAIVDNQEQMMALLDRAIAAQPHVLYWTLGVVGLASLLLTSRLYLAAPATVERRRIVVFDSWRLSKGNMLRIAATRLLVMTPAAIVVMAVQSVFGLGLGLNVGDTGALAGQAQTAPALFALFYGLAGAAQAAVLGALEAGLAAYLYKGLKPADISAVA